MNEEVEIVGFKIFPVTSDTVAVLALLEEGHDFFFLAPSFLIRGPSAQVSFMLTEHANRIYEQCHTPYM